MKKFFFYFSCLFTLSIFAFNIAQSQVTVSGSTGANGTYSSLTQAGGAFAVINAAGSQAGNNIVINITADVTTEDGANPLNASDWMTLTIKPDGGGARTISGSITGHLIDLNGADNVTIDGLNSGENSLTISNAGTGAASAIRFIADATNNTVTNCTVMGSTDAASNGVILFSTGTATGNDNNIISNCNITAAGANLPLSCIHSLGTASMSNSNNTVNNCNISNYYRSSAAVSSAGILLNTNNSTWTITNNRLFQTATRTYISTAIHYGIYAASGDGYIISGNIIGYASESGTGTTNMIGLSAGTLGGTFPSDYTAGGTAVGLTYRAIRCDFTAGGAVSSIQGNTIAGFAMYTSSSTSTTTGIFCGINVSSGNADIGTTTGNTIGSTSSTGSIYTATTTTGGAIVGIYATSTNTVNIQNNTIGALDAMGTTSSVSGGINGINSAGTAGVFNISGNTIGNSTNPNLRCGNLTLISNGNLTNATTGTTFGVATGTGTFRGILNSATGAETIGTGSMPNIVRNASVNSSSTSALFRGIENSGGVTAITNNTISNLTTNSTNITVATAGLPGLGILITSTTAGSVITQNTISGLSLSNTTTTATNVSGVGIANATSLIVSKNIIYDISNASTSTTAASPGTASGIFLRSATTNIDINNNMISLGTSQTNNTAFIGIYGNHGSTPNPVCNIYFNSVYITGTASSGAQPSYGYLRGDFSATARTPTVDIRNNLIVNNRTGGTGKHYAIGNNVGTTASTTGWGANASNYNLLNASASTIGYWSGDQTFSGWKIASASDANSKSGSSVTFVNTATGDLHLNMGLTPTGLESGGITGTGITVDIDNQTRPGPPGSVNGGATAPDFGADEFDGVPGDDVPPSILYTLLTPINSTANRSLSPVTITDASGVNGTSGTSPRVYFKRSTDANTFNDNTSGTDGWKYTESTGSSPFSFTIDYSLLNGGGGVIIGDVVQYFVVAQDLSSSVNVGINNGVFAATPVSVALTSAAFPIGGTINSYMIIGAPLAGDYTVGVALFNRESGKNITFKKVITKVMKEVFAEDESAGNNDNSSSADETSLSYPPNGKMMIREVEEISYVPMENGKVYEGPLYVKRSENRNLSPDAGTGVYATITAAVNDLNLRGSSAAVRFLLLDASYPTETFPITVNYSTASSTNTLTILPNTGVTSSVIGAAPSSQIFKIMSSYVTIDGSNSGGSTRDLSLENTSATTPQVVLIGSSGVPITNCVLKNCNVRNGVVTSSAVVVSDADSSGTAGYFNDITIQNNSIEKAYIGSYSIAVVTPGNGSGLNLLSNTINTLGANNVRFVGIYVQGVDGATVRGNDLGNFEKTSDESDRGVWFATGTKNSVIEKNVIHDLNYTGTSNNGGKGMSVSSGVTGSGIMIRNNMIYNLTGDGNNFATSGSTNQPVGIYIFGSTTQTGVEIYFNSIYLYGSSLNIAGAYSIGIAIDDLSQATVINNSIHNDLGRVAALGTGAVALSAELSSAQFSSINFNNYYCNTGNGTNSVGKIAGTDYATLGDFQAATGQDAGSISGDPLYISTTNLHADSTGSSPLNNAGTPVGGITTDIDNDTRSISAPDIGADEFNSQGGLTNNVGVLAILNPTAGINVLTGASITPQATIRNFGTANQTTPFNTTCTINPGGYSSVVADTLSAGHNRNLTFSSFSPAIGILYTVTVYTTLIGDTNPNNDTLRITSSFIFQNYGNDSGYFYVNNLGTSQPSFPTYCWKDTSGSKNLVLNGVQAAGTNLTGSLDDGYFILSLKNILLSLGQDTTDKHLKYNGVCYDSIFPGSNGVIGFTQAFGTYSINDFNVDGAQVAKNALLPLWHDMDLATLTFNLQNRLSYKAKGDQLIITYDKIAAFAPENNWVSFQVVIEIVTGCGSANSNFRYTYADTTTGQTSGAFVSDYMAQYPAIPPAVTTFRNYIVGYSQNGAPIPYAGYVSSANPFPASPSTQVNIKRPIFNLSTNRGLAVEFGPDQNSLNIHDCLTLCVSLSLEGLQSGGRVRDTVDIIIRDALTPPYKVMQTERVYLDSAHNGSYSYGIKYLEFEMLKRGHPVYIVIKHRNSIRSWSNSTSTMNDTLSYNFTSGTGQTFGNNSTTVNGAASFYTGDITQDGVVDGSDGALVDNAAAEFKFGDYVLTDLNWDGIVDGSDGVFTDNNSANFISEIMPPGASSVYSELPGYDYKIQTETKVIPDVYMNGINKEELERIYNSEKR